MGTPYCFVPEVVAKNFEVISVLAEAQGGNIAVATRPTQNEGQSRKGPKLFVRIFGTKH